MRRILLWMVVGLGPWSAWAQPDAGVDAAPPTADAGVAEDPADAGLDAAPVTVEIVDEPPSFSVVAEAPPNDCDLYCAQMDERCPDVFLGNNATCKRTCALYPPGTADVGQLGCRIFGAPDGPLVEAADPPAPKAPTRAKVIIFDDHPQLWAEQSVIPEGYGAVFFPAIGLADQEPIVAISENGRTIAEGPAGRRIVLEPGEYRARLGNGSESDQIVHDVTVVAGRTTIIDVNWAALEVAVVDPNFVPFRGAYELISMATRDVVGVGFGADALVGERVGVWILPPGLYRLVQPGGTYRDRTNFSTVRLAPGKKTSFVLVQNPDTGEFLGAGEVDPSQLTSLGNWLLRGVIGGDFSLNQVRDLGETYGGRLFVDMQISYNSDPHNWTTRLDIGEAGEVDNQQEGASGKYRVIEDRVFLNSIYVFSLTSWFGPYIRAGFEAQVQERDETDLFPNADNPQVGGAFAPTEPFQGAGGNFRVVRTRNLELDLRLGYGARQVVPNGLQLYNPTADTFTDVPFSRKEGPEASAVGFARITRWVTISTNFEGLLPVTGTDKDPTFSWRNQVGLRLASFASLNYRLNLDLNPAKGIDPTLVVQDLQLRFSYSIF